MAIPATATSALVGVPHSSGNGSTERDQHLAPARRAQYVRLVPPRPIRNSASGPGRVPHARSGRRAVALSHGQRSLASSISKVISTASMGRGTAGLDRRRSCDHRPHPEGYRGIECAFDRGRKAALVHFDAHRDDYEISPHWLGSVRSAAHWAAYTIGRGDVDPDHSMQLGMRGNPIEPRGRSTRATRLRIIPAETNSSTSGPRRSSDHPRAGRRSAGLHHLRPGRPRLLRCAGGGQSRAAAIGRSATYEAIRLAPCGGGLDIVGGGHRLHDPEQGHPLPHHCHEDHGADVRDDRLIADRLRSQRQASPAKSGAATQAVPA